MTQKSNHPHISLILLTKNEAKNLEKNFDWLKTCRSIKEVVIVDDNSTDNTTTIATTLASKNRIVKVFNHSLNNDFALQRNFAVSKCKYNWIFWLDADERPTSKLVRFLNHFDKHLYKAYSFKRQDIFLKQTLRHGENASLNFTRLFNKNYGKFIGQVHEIWKTKKNTNHTDLVISHYSHQTIKSFVQKINFYTDIRSHELFDQGVHTNIFQVILFPIGKFVQNYFLRLGFLDGTGGIMMSICMSFHVFLNKAKLWHLYKQQS